MKSVSSASLACSAPSASAAARGKMKGIMKSREGGSETEPAENWTSLLIRDESNVGRGRLHGTSAVVFLHLLGHKLLLA